jgi:hypothetical protein
MVKCLYINPILNNFVLINFDVSMAENVIVDPPRPEDQVISLKSIPMVPIGGPSK